MKLKTYFRILGFVEFFGVGAAIVWWLIDTIGAAYLSRGWSVGVSILILILILFFGPALGFLFLTAANYLEDNEKEDETENQKRAIKIRSYDAMAKEDGLKRSNFKEGEEVILKSDIAVDNRVIQKGEIGRVARVDETEILE